MDFSAEPTSGDAPLTVLFEADLPQLKFRDPGDRPDRPEPPDPPTFPDYDPVEIVAIRWDFGDGTTAEGERVSHTYANPGTYDVAMTIDLSNEERLQEVKSDLIRVDDPDTPNEPPVADAGADQIIRLGDTAMLDGGDSSDPEGASLSFAWALLRRPTGSAAAIANEETQTPRLTFDLPGDYEVELVVDDGALASPPDLVRITVQPIENRAPVADAGGGQDVFVALLVQLDGRGSSDPDGDDLTFAWRFASMPEGSQSVLSDAAGAMPTFTPDQPGPYVLELIVNDGFVSSAPDAVTVTASPLQNRTPVAHAGPDRYVDVGALVELDGTSSTDADGDSLAFFWVIEQAPAGSSAALDNATAAASSFVADAAGTYVVSLTVSDGSASSEYDLITITASETVDPNTAPTADAGPDQSAPTGAQVQLDGSASTDAEGDVLAYRWTLAVKPSSSVAELDDSNAATPAFRADAAGLYELRLIVNDGSLDSDPDVVRITATGGPVNRSPVAFPGLSRTVYLGARVMLDGMGSSDADGDPLTFTWSLTSLPPGSNAALESVASAETAFTPDLAGGGLEPPTFGL